MHTVEKIGGTSMTRFPELMDTIFCRDKDVYNRIFVVSAYSGMTNLLLDHKKTGKDGVYSLFVRDKSWAWSDALSEVSTKMQEVNAELFKNEPDRQQADGFIRERIEGVRSCLMDLQRLCGFGHFRIEEHLRTVRELLSGLGEVHSAYNSVLYLQNAGIQARFVDLSGWRQAAAPSLDSYIMKSLGEIDLASELPIVTGYAQSPDGMVATYDRGYTEITFSRIAVLTKAREAIIHKEFHLSSADPNLVGPGKALPIGRTNYDVADQLSDMGMEAIHPKAAKGLRQAKIPLRIKHSFEPEHKGTLITSDYQSAAPMVEIIAGQPRVIALSYHNQDMVGDCSETTQLAGILHRKGLHYLAKDTNANTVTHYLDASLEAIARLRDAIEDNLPGKVTTEKVAVISVIGSNLSLPGILARTANALAEADINILAVHQNLRQVDIRFIIRRDEYQEAVRVLHKELIESMVAGDETPEDLASAMAPN